MKVWVVTLTKVGLPNVKLYLKPDGMPTSLIERAERFNTPADAEPKLKGYQKDYYYYHVWLQAVTEEEITTNNKAGTANTGPINQPARNHKLGPKHRSNIMNINLESQEQQEKAQTEYLVKCTLELRGHFQQPTYTRNKEVPWDQVDSPANAQRFSKPEAEEVAAEFNKILTGLKFTPVPAPKRWEDK